MLTITKKMKYVIPFLFFILISVLFLNKSNTDKNILNKESNLEKDQNCFFIKTIFDDKSAIENGKEIQLIRNNKTLLALKYKNFDRQDNTVYYDLFIIKGAKIQREIFVGSNKSSLSYGHTNEYTNFLNIEGNPRKKRVYKLFREIIISSEENIQINISFRDIFWDYYSLLQINEENYLLKRKLDKKIKKAYEKFALTWKVGIPDYEDCLLEIFHKQELTPNNTKPVELGASYSYKFYLPTGDYSLPICNLETKN